MIKRLLTAAVLLGGLLGFSTAQAAWSPPADVTNRVGRAQEFLFNWSSDEYNKSTSLERRDFVWDNSGVLYPIRFPASTWSSVYVATTQTPGYPLKLDPAHTIYACGVSQTCNYNWVNTNHPSWIIRCGSANCNGNVPITCPGDAACFTHSYPAWQFHDRLWTVMDISNATVQSTILQYFVGAQLAIGFQGVSIDNGTVMNIWDEEGTCSVPIPFSAYDSNGNPTQNAVPTGTCEGLGGTWTQLYTDPNTFPGLVDPGQFLTNRVAWYKAITAKAHSMNAGSVLNFLYDARQIAWKATADSASRQTLAVVDGWYQETGWNGDNIPSPCLVGGVAWDQALSGTTAAQSPTITLSGSIPAGPFVLNSPIAIFGAGPNGGLYLGVVAGAPVGQVVPISPVTSTAITGGTVYVAERPDSMFGPQWVNMVNFRQTLSPQIFTVTENSMCPMPYMSRQVVEWAIGSDLVSKPALGARSYVTMYFADANDNNGTDSDTDGKPGGDWPEWYWQHGAPIDASPKITAPVSFIPIGIYFRRFANGLVVCNPNLPGYPALPFDLGTAQYHSFDNMLYTGVENIPGPSCVMLQNGPSQEHLPGAYPVVKK